MIILIHNYSSGDPTPSYADVQLTQTIVYTRDACF